jgi:hypothetical protein
MNPDIITVQPAPAQRVAFARWATGYPARPIRTCSSNEFAVPADLFTQAPEAILVGSLVDGHPYRAVLEEDAAPAPVTEDVKEAGHVCSVCGKIAASAAGLGAHRRAKHGEGE